MAETPYMRQGYKTEPGLAGSMPQAPQAEPETREAKFYTDNQYWLVGEVNKFLAQNQQEQAKDQKSVNEYGDESEENGLLGAVDDQ